MALTRLISLLVGEMAGRLEGGAKDRDLQDLSRKAPAAVTCCQHPAGKNPPISPHPKTCRIIALTIFHGTPVRTGYRGGSAGAGLAGGRFSCWVFHPLARALAAVGGGNAEATERGQAAGARTSRHILSIGRHGLAPRLPNFLPETGAFFDNGQARKRAWR